MTATMAATTTTLDETSPDAAWVTGTCPKCGAQTVTMPVFTRGLGNRHWYMAVSCWRSMGHGATCDYTTEKRVEA